MEKADLRLSTSYGYSYELVYTCMYSIDTYQGPIFQFCVSVCVGYYRCSSNLYDETSRTIFIVFALIFWLQTKGDHPMEYQIQWAHMGYVLDLKRTHGLEREWQIRYKFCCLWRLPWMRKSSVCSARDAGWCGFGCASSACSASYTGFHTLHTRIYNQFIQHLKA